MFGISFGFCFDQLLKYLYLSTKKVLYAVFFTGEGVAIKVLVKSVTGKYYKDVVLKKLIKYFRKLPLVLNMSVFYMTMPTCIPPLL